jgi:diguanylate cyclase (GGDEF)-like protein
MRVVSCLFEEHNLYLVALAALICVLGAAVTTRLYGKARQTASRGRLPWLFLGAVAGGATLWCTHFVAMLAYQPGLEVTYAPALTGLSLIVAMLGCGLALSLGATRVRAAPAAGGVLFGLTGSAMHYLGMAAFTADAFVFWAPAYVAASVVAAMLGGGAAFHVAATARLRWSVLIAPALLVLAIVSLHFTGMGAVTVLPLAPAVDAPRMNDGEVLLAIGVAVVGFLMLGTAVASHALEAQSERLSRSRLTLLIEGAVDGMLVEADGVVTMANAAFASLAGIEPGAASGSPASRWIDDVGVMTPGKLVQSRLTTEDGSQIPVEVALREEDGAEPGRTVRIFAVRDLRSRLAQERRIAHLARNDSLTGLPNRASFLEKLERTAAANDADGSFALLAIDLDRFKDVNDLYGHAVGDRLLVHVAAGMKAALAEGEFVARLGGDEFVAIIPATDRLGAQEAAERLHAAIVQPLVAEHAQLQCGASIGMALWPDDAHEPSALINNADLAMYRAKASPSTDICFYEEAMDEAVRQRRRVTLGLRDALENDRFEIHYQLQASVETGEITGYEALLRWRLEDGTFISPADFIPLAEETGLILPIGEWVLRRACAEAASWPQPHRLAVNLSPVQLSNADLPRLIHRILLETGLSPRRLELEITETAMISDMERSTHILRQIKALGVSVAMDDFGTGYSSLSTLRAFPFDKIKLDRSFMAELDGGPQSRAIIRAVLTLGESLEIPILAEGVETEEQLRFLKEQGCDEIQGYLIGRPSRDAPGAALADREVA